jgi:hypothetical protein
MKHLFLLEAQIFQSDSYFDNIIDVNIYGDIEGYKYFAEMIGKAI